MSIDTCRLKAKYNWNSSNMPTTGVMEMKQFGVQRNIGCIEAHLCPLGIVAVRVCVLVLDI